VLAGDGSIGGMAATGSGAASTADIKREPGWRVGLPAHDLVE
jgi:hypothetical protein